MSKRGLPTNLKMRHDWHYVEELSKAQRSIGRVLPIGQIEPNPLQPRVEVGDLEELAASIKERGVLEPLLVKPLSDNQKWLIIAGERRWRAAQIAGLTEVPCVELDVSDAQIAEIALIENLQRKDLTVWEEADGLAALSQRFNYTHEDIAQRIGKSRTSVTEALTIAALPREIREKCVQAEIKTKSAILQIARQFDDEAMLKAIEHSKQQNSNYKKTDEPFAEPPNNSSKDASEKLQTVKTNLQHPVRIYNYQPNQGDFKLALKFKKPVEKSAIINALRSIIEELEKD